MSPLDSQLIQRKIRMIQEDLDQLIKHTTQSKFEYLNSTNTQLITERLLERSIGRMIDINMHLAKESFETFPKDYFSSFILLANHDVLPKELASQLAKSAGLRNILAHEYDEIDPSQIYTAAHAAIKQIPEYLASIIRFLESTSK